MSQRRRKYYLYSINTKEVQEMKTETKKIIGIILAVCVVFAMTFLVAAGYSFEVGAYAEEYDFGDADSEFIENAVALAKDSYVGDISLTTTKENLYDIDLEPLGYIYDFVVNGEPGYAMVIYQNGAFNLTEIYFNVINPYYGLSGIQRIYLKEFNYLYYLDGEYFIAETDTPVTDEIMEILRQGSYYSSVNSLDSSEGGTIYYVSKSEDSNELALRHPGIVQVSGYTNACAPIAGANLIQYWDRYKTNLIPNYTPGRSLANYYLYQEPGTATDGVVGQLFTDMGTNTIESGTSIPQFKAGMTTYCSRAGYSISYNSCMQNGQFSFSVAKQRIDAGQPLALFVENLTVATIYAQDGYDEIDYSFLNGSHVMAGFGYKEIEYVLNNGTTQVNYFIAVASGLSSRSRGYYNINYSTVIDDAYGINIA